MDYLIQSPQHVSIYTFHNILIETDEEDQDDQDENQVMSKLKMKTQALLPQILIRKYISYARQYVHPT